MKAHQTKTNAVRLLDAANVKYELRNYPVDESDLSAVHVAQQISLPPEQVFKTLVARGDKTGILMACIPADTELDLKALASASGNKKVGLVAVKEITGLTGYVRGGVSPLGVKKAYPFFLDETAQLFNCISVSAGVRGTQMLLAPSDLINLASAHMADLGRNEAS